MDLLTINQSKCKKDGVCVASCPMAIIKLQDGDGYPEIIPVGDQVCISCGHCVAVCPHGALNHARVPVEGCPAIRKELMIGEDQAVQFLRSRRSIRAYKDTPVEKEKIERLIEIGRYAPTGSNTQLVEWLVFNDKAKIKTLAGTAVDWMRHVLNENQQSAPLFPYLPLVVAAWDAGFDAVLRNAPVLVVAMAPEEVGNGMVDLSLALCYLELAAPTLGVGTCWAGILYRALLNWPPLREALGIPERYPHYYPMMLGYPKFKYQLLPERRSPKITWR